MTGFDLARFIFLLDACINVLWGTLLLLEGPIPSTELSWILRFTGSTDLAGFLLLAIGFTVIYVIGYKHSSPMLSFITLICSLPFVFAPALGSIGQVMLEHYADGTPRPWYFILTGQTRTICIALIESAAFISFFRGNIRWTTRQ